MREPGSNRVGGAFVRIHGQAIGPSSRAVVGLLTACSRGAGISRCRSRSAMNASYFAVPGRGGASAGRPPAHCGM